MLAPVINIFLHKFFIYFIFQKYFSKLLSFSYFLSNVKALQFK